MSCVTGGRKGRARVRVVHVAHPIGMRHELDPEHTVSQSARSQRAPQTLVRAACTRGAKQAVRTS